MKWQVGITTAPRKADTLRQTLVSLKKAEFPDPYIFCEPNSCVEGINCKLFLNEKKLGIVGNFHNALRNMLKEKSDMLFIMADDVLLSKNLKKYLDKVNFEDNCLYDIFEFPYEDFKHNKPPFQWYEIKKGFALAGAISWIMTYKFAEELFCALPIICDIEPDLKPIDAYVGKWALDTNKKVLVHSPSLAFHNGNGISTISNWQCTRTVISPTFIESVPLEYC